MPFPHLILQRLDRAEDRRRQPAPIRPPERVSGPHGRAIRQRVDAAAATQAALPPIQGIDPELILRVNLAAPVQEEAWRAAGFRVLAQEQDKILVVFTNDVEMRLFKERLAAYQQGAPPGQRNPPFNGLFASIEDIGNVEPADRIGARFKADGIDRPAHLVAHEDYLVDIELWDAPTRLALIQRVDRFVEHIERLGAEVDSRYVGTAGVIVLRARITGQLLRIVLDMPAVSRIDLPPIPDLGERDPPVVNVQNIPAPPPPPEGAPLIGIIDSGSVDHPLLVPSLFASIGIPEALGSADGWGHGTKVAGIATFGDVRRCVDEQRFESRVRIISVRVVNDQGQFDNADTVPDQMEKAIRELHRRGCRIINLSLGDKHKIPYDGGRLSAWAATLDNLSRELDVLVLVSAGNSAGDAEAPWGVPSERILQAYPGYLVDPSNRIVDPATAAIALTIGSLAHANGLPANQGGAELRSVTELDHPTPVTRCGPGVNDSIKPDLVDYGGTCLFDGWGGGRIVTGAHYASAGMLALRSEYLQGLLTSMTGTSAATPRVAFKAAELLRALPNISANMLRALLALSAEPPAAALALLEEIAPAAARNCLGYGVANSYRAINSDERRVVLVADRQEVAVDQFALYRVPLPPEFQTTKGTRHIRVSLAFDPPVRYTRLEYLGVRLNYHLIRGVQPDDIFEHFRSRRADEAPFERLPGTAKCNLQPSRDTRGTSTLQRSCFTMKRNVENHGDTYYLAVFAERRWAGDEVTHQRFAVAVEIEHEAEINLYQALQVPIRIRA